MVFQTDLNTESVHKTGMTFYSHTSRITLQSYEKIVIKRALEPLKFQGFMLNLKEDFFAEFKRPFRFVKKLVSFENARTFRFADYIQTDISIAT